MQFSKTSLLALSLGALGACSADKPSIEPTNEPAELAADLTGPGRISVMTQNQFLGADLTPIITAPDPVAFNEANIAALARITENRIQLRAYALALEIALKRPDVVGLQEMFSFTNNGANGEAPFRDHLADTLTALSDLGLDYTVVAQVQNMNVTIPVDRDRDGTPETAVGVRDRDVILVRGGLAATPVPYSSLCARPSADGGPGCNYQIVASAPLPVGTLTIERGFVGVDVTVNGRPYRVVDTHLEVPDLDPSNPLSPAVQAAQAQELTAILAASTPADRTLITLGDFNSSPEDEITQVGDITIVPPYIQMVAAGHIDTWNLDPRERQENTCCHAEDLSDPASGLFERIDLIFSKTAPASVRADVLNDHPIEYKLFGRWATDHAVVAAKLQY